MRAITGSRDAYEACKELFVGNILLKYSLRQCRSILHTDVERFRV